MIRNDVIYGLYLHNSLVITHNPTAENRPPYPFMGYTVTSPYLGSGHGNEDYDLVPSENPSFDFDALTRVDLQPEATLSFTAYAETTTEALSIAKDAWNWFRVIGTDYLASKGIVVVEVMPIQTRDLLEVDQYERREGFDVRFRFDDRIENRIETIETYTIEEVES